MKITTLIENTALSPAFAAEHGLSLFVETENSRFLFDAGQSGAFADNAARLGIDLRTADFAVLSHGHYDHGGGMLRFLERNRRAKIYVTKTPLRATATPPSATSAWITGSGSPGGWCAPGTSTPSPRD